MVMNVCEQKIITSLKIMEVLRDICHVSHWPIQQISLEWNCIVL